MNRYSEDTPYVFRPPRFSRLLAPLICWLSDVFYLRRQYRVAAVKLVAGADAVREKQMAGQSLILAPNHSDHADPHVLMHVGRSLGLELHFVAAREIFLANHGLNGMVLQRAGVFSIDREGSDLKSIKTAMEIVEQGRHPLVMFPEGEVFHLNAQLTPLNEGVAVIALRTARRLRKKGVTRSVSIVPTALRYRYLGDISATFDESMSRLEKTIHWAPQADKDIRERIYRFGEALLTLKEKQYGYEPSQGDLSARLEALQETLVSHEEAAYLGAAGNGPHPERIRRVRGKIRQLLLADPPPAKTEISACRQSLDRLYDAVRMYSYPGQYLRGNPTPERIAETILKFEEDLLGDAGIKKNRQAEVVFCEPIDMDAFLDCPEADRKTAPADITRMIAERIETVLAPA